MRTRVFARRLVIWLLKPDSRMTDRLHAIGIDNVLIWCFTVHRRISKNAPSLKARPNAHVHGVHTQSAQDVEIHNSKRRSACTPDNLAVESQFSGPISIFSLRVRIRVSAVATFHFFPSWWSSTRFHSQGKVHYDWQASLLPAIGNDNFTSPSFTVRGKNLKNAPGLQAHPNAHVEGIHACSAQEVEIRKQKRRSARVSDHFAVESQFTGPIRVLTLRVRIRISAVETRNLFPSW